MSNFASQKPLGSAVFLLKQIQSKAIDVTKLNTHQRRICVRYLLHAGQQTVREIADIMQVCEMTIWRDKAKFREQNGWMLDELDERKIATDIIIESEKSVTRLRRQGREKDAFEVLISAVEILQSLGYLKKRPVQIEGNVTLAEVLKLAAESQTTNASPDRNGVPQINH